MLRVLSFCNCEPSDVPPQTPPTPILEDEHPNKHQKFNKEKEEEEKKEKEKEEKKEKKKGKGKTGYESNKWRTHRACKQKH